MIALIAACLLLAVAICLLGKPNNDDGETFAYSWLVVFALLMVFAAERFH